MTTSSNLGAYTGGRCDPTKPAVIGVDADGTERILTHRELDERADAVARGLVRAGLRRGEHAVILSANRPESIACLLGTMRAGMIATPINHAFSPATIATLVAESDARLVFCDGARARDLALPDVMIVDFDADFAAWLDPGSFEPIEPQADTAALCLYTSGSTGRPKGVLLSHAAHLWVVKTRMQDDDVADERLLIAAPLYHMNALALCLLAFASGATIVLLPRFETRLYLAAIGRYRCTWLTAVPPMIAMMLADRAALATADLSSVRTLRMGSAPVNDALAAQIGTLLPQARVINAYGTTEGGPIVFAPHPDGRPTPPGAVGVPHREVACRLVGPEAPTLGVLQMRSPAVMLGYLKRPDVRSPITPDGFYDTGDVFRRDADDFFSFVGRADDMFVSGAENIFPGEVEALLETHPDVLQACVVPVADEIKGTKPVAFVVLRPGSDIDEAALKQHALANAPAFQHPRRVWILDRLPLATTNKIDRAALRRRAEDEIGTPDGTPR